MRRYQSLISSAAVLFGHSWTRSKLTIAPTNFEGGSVSVDTSTGARCSSSERDRASLNAGAYTAESGDTASAVMIAIPFGGRDQGDCSQLLKHEEGRSRLELAAQLFEAGALTAEEFKAIADDVASLIR